MRFVVYALTAMVSVLLLTIIPSCTHNPYIPEEPSNNNDTIPTVSNTCSTDSVYFVNDLLPILIGNCAVSGCHDAVTSEEGYDFSSYAGFINTDAVRGGDLNDSELYEVITETDPDKLMPPPPRTPLTAAQIQMFRTWILQGASYNSCNSNPATCDTTGVTFSGTVQPILQATCYGCHSSGAPSGNVVLDTYAGVSSVVNDGSLLGAIKHQQGFVAMPQGGSKLPDCSIAKIEAWINAGAANN